MRPAAPPRRGANPADNWSSSTQSSTRLSGIGLAGDQAVSVGRIPRQIARQLGIGRLARPFGGVERLAVGPRPTTSLSPALPEPAAEACEMSDAAISSLLISIHGEGLVAGFGGGAMVGFDREDDRRRLRYRMVSLDPGPLDFGLAISRRCAPAFRHQVDNNAARGSSATRRGGMMPSVISISSKPRLIAKRERKPRRAAPQRLPVVRRGKAISGQVWRVRCVACRSGLAGFDVNRE